MTFVGTGPVKLLHIDQLVNIGGQREQENAKDNHLCPSLSTESGSLQGMPHCNVSVQGKADNQPTGHNVDDVSEVITDFTSEVRMIV